MSDRKAALHGVRVLDLADESAVFATRILADLGADVILVEPPAGSRVRHLAPFLDDESGVDRSLVHLYHDANKRSVRIDPTTAGGRDRFARLVESADVVVETNRRDDAPLRARNPGLVHVSVTPFGLEAEWRERRANDLVAGAAGGLLFVCGERADPPVQGAAHPVYAMASLAAATGVMLALAARDRDPQRRGAHLDISLQEAAAMAVLQTANPTWYAWHGQVPGRPGLSAALQCKDGGWIGFVPRPDRFEGFLAWVREAGIESELGPDDWPWARVGAPSRGNPVAAATRELARRLTREEFMARAWQADLLCLPITDFPYMDGHEHFEANEQFLSVAHEPLGRSLGFVRSPVDAMSREIPIVRAPLLGEHDAQVSAELERSAAPRARPAQLADGPAGLGDPRRALEGVRVVDFCWVLAGPLGTRILANFGAEVIRVESSARPDGMRLTPGPDGKVDPDLGGLFNDANAGKRSLTVDLRREEGRALVRRLIARSDVVTNNYRPGALDRMGFGYETVARENPGVIVLNMPGTHRRGAWAPRSTLGNTVMGASGYNHLMGFPGRRPRGLGVAYPDFTSPYLLATTVIAALRERELTGRGQELDLSQLSGMISLLGVEWMQYAASGVQPPPSANRDPNACPHGVDAARGDDEWVAIAVEDDAEWESLCRAMGRAGGTEDRRFATHAARKANEDDVDALVSAWTRERDRFEIADLLQAQGIAAAAVASLRDTYEQDPQLRHHYQQVRQPNAPDVDIPIDGEAIRFVGVDHRLERAPMLGEHNEHVLCTILGLSREEHDRLIVDGVVA